MNIRDYVRRFINRGSPAGDADESRSPSTPEVPDGATAAGIAALGGMSTATARFVIERNVPENFDEIWEVGELRNRGRYYIAKVVRPDGTVIDELLVDKQSGSVHFLKNRAPAR